MSHHIIGGFFGGKCDVVSNYCKLFKYIFVPLDMEKDKFNWYVDTKHARSDPTLCGPDGNYFKPIELLK
jgi:hypothetical protein